MFLPGHSVEVLSGGAAEPGSLDVYQQGVRVHRQQRRAGLDDSFHHLQHDLHISALTPKIRRPETALATEQCGDDRLIEGGIPAHQAGVAPGKGGGVTPPQPWGYSVLANSRRSQKGQP